MFQNYIKVAFRNLFKNKLYSAINIIGLSVGLAACVLITLFVREELSFDKFWDNSDSLHRMQMTFNIPGREPFVAVSSSGPVKQALKQYFPQDIEAATRFTNMNPLVRRGENINSERITWTDAETADMFSFDVIKGDLKATLTNTTSIALNQTMAVKYFGENDPIGEVLTITNYGITKDYSVTAVFNDLPHNSILNMQALVLIDETEFIDQPWIFAQWFSVNAMTFFQLKDGSSINSIANGIAGFTEQYIEVPPMLPPETSASEFIKFNTIALPDIQLNAVGQGEMKPIGDKQIVMVFIAIAGLILLIAVINFMNLATAKSTQRAREVALRKVLGAKRSQLIVQFLGESILIALIGLLFGIVLVELALPFYNDYIGRDLVFNITDGVLGLILVCLVVFVGVVGGIYPALVLSGFLPAHVLKANKSAETSGSATLRNTLVVLQFAISIGLIVSTATVFGQMYYATNMDPGFKKDNMLVVYNVGREAAADKRDVLYNNILQNNNVNGVAFSGDEPSGGNNNNTGVELLDNPEVGNIIIGVQRIDHDFFKTYEIPFIAGRDYDRDRATDGTPSAENGNEGDILEGSVVINESAVTSLGFSSPEEALGKTLRTSIGSDISADLVIIGVIGDVNFESLREKVRPEIYTLDDVFYAVMTVSFTGNPIAIASEIEALWKDLMPNVPFSYDYVDQNMAAEFEQETALSVMLGIFSILAVLIACLGLYGLAVFTAVRRTKEIGIRKVMGAGVVDIVRLLIWQFSKPVIVANLIAWPITAWGLIKWLEQFPYRLDTWVLIPLCLTAGLLALLIAWGTVGGNAAKVARTNPIKALRYE
jgi:putative ABC transport system permease protein